MPLIVKDRVRETSTSTGTGNIILNGAVAGFQSFAEIGNANTTYYTIVDATTGQFEVGIGTYTLATTTLSRDTVLESSAGGAAVNFAANVKDVFVTYPAERSVDTTTAQTLTNKTLTSPVVNTPNITGGTINNASIGASTPSTGSFTSLTDSGNLNFTGTGNRITGDFGNTTVANRVAFQTSTVNGITGVAFAPNGTGAVGGIACFNNSDLENSSTASFRADSSLVQIISGSTGSGTFLPITFHTSGSERVRVVESGDVGIGTSSPTARLMSVSAVGQNSANFTDNVNYTFEIKSGGLQVAYIGGQAGSALALAANGAERMRIDASGNVGIGTSSPTQKLDVVGNVFITSILRLTGDGTAATPSIQPGNDNDTGFFRAASNVIGFSTGGTERARIDSAGNVGIGTSSPASKLHVAGAARLGNTVIQDNFIELGQHGSGDRNSRIDFHSSGAPATLDFNARIIRGLSVNGNFELFNTGGGAFVVGTNSAERLRIDSSGNVGIGTSTTTNGNLTVQKASATTDAPVLTLHNSNASAANTCGYLRFFSNESVRAELSSVIDAAGPFAGNFIFKTGEGTLTERARIASNGDFLVGTTSAAGRLTVVGGTSSGASVQAGFGGVNATSFRIFHADDGGSSATACVAKIERVSSTSRSVNAAGTINASGADYAEYMTKAGEFTVAKGDVVGINAEGKLTNVFAEAISFCVKSTDPSYVGNDKWGCNFEEDQEGLEAARQCVDRIAFAGQVPVNVLGATPGQFIIPVKDNGAIAGQAVSNPTFEQYQISVGKVIAVEGDGRARIIVKVS